MRNATHALVLGAAVVVHSVTATVARAQTPESRIPSSLTADSATRAALASRLPRLHSDTVRAYPLRRLANGVYAVLGDTGRGSEGRPNAGFIVTPQGVVVIDALASPAEGRALLRTIRTITPAPVRWLVLTHHHPDHTFGAIVFKRAGATVIAHPDRQMLAAMDGDDALASDWTGVMGLREMQGFAFADTPDIAVTGDTTFTIGGRAIEVFHPAAAHTAGDLVVWLPADHVMFAGDLLIEDGVTLVVDGSSAALLQALDRLDQLHPMTVVPGHGRIPEDAHALIARTRCSTRALRTRIWQALRDGTRMSRVLASFPPADRDRPVSLASRNRRNAERVYMELQRAMMEGDAPPPDVADTTSSFAACQN